MKLPSLSRGIAARFNPTAPFRAALAVSVASLLAIGSLQAQSSFTWDSSGTNPTAPVNGAGTWDTSTALWSDGTNDNIWNNADNDIAVFGGGSSTGSGGTVTLGTGITVGGITFNTSGYTITGSGTTNTLTFGGASPAIVTNAAATISQTLINTNGLNIVKSGTGILTLQTTTSAASFTGFTGGGSLEVANGQLVINDSPQKGGFNLGTTNIIVDAGKSLKLLYGTGLSGGSITLGAGSQFGIQNGNNAGSGGISSLVSSNIILNAGSGSANAAQIGGFNFGNSTNITSTISGTGDLRWVNSILGGGSNTATLTSTGLTNGWEANSYTGNTSFEGTKLTFAFSGATSGSTITPFGNTSGAVTATGGAVLTFSASGGAASATNVQIANAITFSSGATNTLSSIDSDLHFTGNVTFSGSTLVQREWGLSSATAGPTKALYFDGIVSGTSTITLQTLNTTAGQTGVVGFTNNANTFSGTVVVNNTVNTAEGTALLLGGNTAMQNATVNLNGNGTGYTANRSIIFASGITAPVIGSLTGNGNVTLQTTDATPLAVNLSVGNNNAATNTYSGVLSGAGGFTKVGTGVQVLTGSNTYSGATNVNNGTLQTGNASALGTGAVTVGAGTLQVGNGTVNTLSGIGALTLNDANAVLDLKTNTGSISLASNQNFTMTLGTLMLNNNSTTTGANVDQITLAGTGTYSLTGGTVDLSGFTNNNVAGTYNIIAGTGTASGLTFANGQAGYTYSIDNAGDLVVAVPEPSTLVLVGIFGFGMLMLFRRRRA